MPPKPSESNQIICWFYFDVCDGSGIISKLATDFPNEGIDFHCRGCVWCHQENDAEIGGSE